MKAIANVYVSPANIDNIVSEPAYSDVLGFNRVNQERGCRLVPPTSSDITTYHDSVINAWILHSTVNYDIYQKNNSTTSYSNYDISVPATETLSLVSRTDGDQTGTWVCYDYCDVSNFPFMATPSVTLDDDLSFNFEIIRRDKCEGADDPYSQILITGIDPPVVAEKNGVTYNYTGLLLTIYYDGIKNPKLTYVDDTYISDRITSPGYDNFPNNHFIEWVIPKPELSQISLKNSKNVLSFRRLGNKLYIENNNSAQNPLVVEFAQKWNLNNMNVYFFHSNSNVYFRMGDIEYYKPSLQQSAAELNFQIDLPFAYVDYSGDRVTPLFWKIHNDSGSTVTIDPINIQGMTGDVVVRLATQNKHYTPILKGIIIDIPPTLTENINDVYTSFNDRVISFSISTGRNETPTASVEMDNGDGSLEDMDGYLGYKIAIDAGYDLTGIRRRFTGTIEDVAYKRNANNSASITLECEGQTGLLDNSALYRQYHDGLYHQDAVKNTVQSAGLLGFITQTPSSDYERLFYGEEDALYEVEIGENLRNHIDEIKEYSGYVLEETEYGDVVYAPRDWRANGISVPYETISGSYDSIKTQYYPSYDTESHISNIDVSYTERDIRNAVVVIGQADKFIEEDPNGIWPAYRPGDPIIYREFDDDLVTEIGRVIPIVIRNSKYNSPEAVIYVAKRLLNIYTQRRESVGCTIIGDCNLYSGATIGIYDPFTMDASVQIDIEGMTERFSDGLYTMSISGIKHINFFNI